MEYPLLKILLVRTSFIVSLSKIGQKQRSKEKKKNYKKNCSRGCWAETTKTTLGFDVRRVGPTLTSPYWATETPFQTVPCTRPQLWPPGQEETRLEHATRVLLPEMTFPMYPRVTVNKLTIQAGGLCSSNPDREWILSCGREISETAKVLNILLGDKIRTSLTKAFTPHWTFPRNSPVSCSERTQWEKQIFILNLIYF